MPRKIIYLTLILFSIANSQINALSGQKESYYKNNKSLDFRNYNGKHREFYDSTRTVKAIYNYKNGLLDGVQKEFYQNGKLHREYYLTEGIKDQYGREYNQDGKLIFERNLKNGNGIGTDYYENGMKMREREYEKGYQTKVSLYNTNINGEFYSRNPEELFFQAQAYANLGWFNHAAKSYELFLQLYKEHALAPKIKFLLAYTYNNYLHNFELAKKNFKEFLETYPGHDLYNSAKFEYENIGQEINKIPQIKE